MKITISKDGLMKMLKLMDHNEHVLSVELKGYSIKLRTSHQVLEGTFFGLYDSSPAIAQKKDQWGDLYLFLLNIEEQPVILTIEENILEATFEF